MHRRRPNDRPGAARRVRAAQAAVTVVWLSTLACSGSTVTATRSTTTSLPPREPAAAPIRTDVLGGDCPATHAEALTRVGVLARERRQVSGTEIPHDVLDPTVMTLPARWPRECVYPEGTCRVIEYDDACFTRTDFRCDVGEDVESVELGRPCDEPTPM
jgi:hypothetical protein